MELPDSRYPRLVPPRPNLVDDFFAPHARPRSLSGASAPTLLHPGSRLTGRPHLDARPIGTTKLVRPEFFIVELSDGRPGLIAAADHTRVWTRPRGSAHRPTTLSLWDRFLTAIAPKAGFILYASDSALPNAEDPNRYLRPGIVYDAIDVGLLKQTMDMTGAEWKVENTLFQWYNNMMNYFVHPIKNGLALRDGIKATEAVQERVVGPPKVKVVAYSGYKTPLAEVERMRLVPAPAGANGNGSAGYEQIINKGGTFDSLWQSNYYDEHERLIGHQVARPSH